jgi:Anti-sigma factor NepR
VSNQRDNCDPGRELQKPGNLRKQWNLRAYLRTNFNGGLTNDKYHQEGGSVTKPTKTGGLSKKVGENQKSGISSESGRPGTEATKLVGVPCLKKASSKSEIADQIGLHLRSVYDDVLAQPVPGRFLELLRQLESTSDSRLNKDAM